MNGNARGWSSFRITIVIVICTLETQQFCTVSVKSEGVGSKDVLRCFFLRCILDVRFVWTRVLPAQ